MNTKVLLVMEPDKCTVEEKMLLRIRLENQLSEFNNPEVAIKEIVHYKDLERLIDEYDIIAFYSFDKEKMWKISRKGKPIMKYIHKSYGNADYKFVKVNRFMEIKGEIFKVVPISFREVMDLC